MGTLWFRKNINLNQAIPGLRLNLSKRGASPSFGFPGFRIGLGIGGITFRACKSILGFSFGWLFKIGLPNILLAFGQRLLWIGILYYIAIRIL